MAVDPVVEPQRDLPTLLERLAEVLMRLVGERLALARVELREELARLLPALVAIAAGVLGCVVGLLLLALATVDALRPLIAARSLRLLVIGGPLTLLCTAAIALATRRLARRA